MNDVVVRPPKEIGSFQDRKFRERLLKMSNDFGASTDATFIVFTPFASFPNSRRLVGSSDIELDDGGAGGDLTLLLNDTGVIAGTYAKVTVDAKGRVTAGSTLSTTEVSEGTNLYFTDARVLLALPQDIDVTDTPEFVNVALSSLSTSGRIVIVGPGGLLVDDADLNFLVDTLASTKMTVKAGTSAGVARVGGAIADFYTDVGNGTTVETDLYSSSLLADTFGFNGDKVAARFAGTILGHATATRQIRVYYSGMVILDTGALTLAVSTAWDITLTLIRVSATVVRYVASVSIPGATSPVLSAVGELTALTLSGVTILKITGQAGGVGAATNDILAKMGEIEWKAAA